MWKDTVPCPLWFYRATQKETSIDGWLSSLETAFLKAGLARMGRIGRQAHRYSSGSPPGAEAEDPEGPSRSSLLVLVLGCALE